MKKVAHRYFSPAFKAGLMIQLLTKEETFLTLGRKHQISPANIYRWKIAFLANAATAFMVPDKSEKQARASLHERIDALTRRNIILEQRVKVLAPGKMKRERLAFVHSKARTLKIARNYRGSCFGMDFMNETAHAYRNGYAQELTEITHTLRAKRLEKQKQANLKLARTYTGTGFSADQTAAYCHAKNHGYIKELRKIVTLKPQRPRNYHSKANTLKVARLYSTRREQQLKTQSKLDNKPPHRKGLTFSKLYPTEYRHATMNGYLDELKKILEKKKTDKI